MSPEIALQVKCPVCQKSLADRRHKLDGRPSVSLTVKLKGKKGWLRLSSLYGSYAVQSEFELPDDAVIRVHCPKCEAALATKVRCGKCRAPMLPLLLREGGRVLFCARKGCKNHLLEFEETGEALAKFYESYTMDNTEAPAGKPAAPAEDQADSEKEIIASGSFLQSYCPHCRHGMNSGGSLLLGVKGRDGKKGQLHLSPYLNVFTNRSTIAIPHGEEVKDLGCTTCGHSLMESKRKCGRCGARVARITLSAMHKLVSFFICMRKGCTWHGLSDEDTQLIMLEDSKEW